MTIINNLTEPEELDRYARDFGLIQIYLQHKWGAAHLKEEMENTLGWRNFSSTYESELAWHKRCVKSMWDNEFPQWIRDLLTREL